MVKQGEMKNAAPPFSSLIIISRSANLSRDSLFILFQRATERERENQFHSD